MDLIYSPSKQRLKKEYSYVIRKPKSIFGPHHYVKTKCVTSGVFDLEPELILREPMGKTILEHKAISKWAKGLEPWKVVHRIPHDKEISSLMTTAADKTQQELDELKNTLEALKDEAAKKKSDAEKREVERDRKELATLREQRDQTKQEQAQSQAREGHNRLRRCERNIHWLFEQHHSLELERTWDNYNLTEAQKAVERARERLHKFNRLVSRSPYLSEADDALILSERERLTESLHRREREMEYDQDRRHRALVRRRDEREWEHRSKSEVRVVERGRQYHGRSRRRDSGDDGTRSEPAGYPSQANHIHLHQHQDSAADEGFRGRSRYLVEDMERQESEVGIETTLTERVRPVYMERPRSRREVVFA